MGFTGMSLVDAEGNIVVQSRLSEIARRSKGRSAQERASRIPFVELY
jgi:hypothetical protein